MKRILTALATIGITGSSCTGLIGGGPYGCTNLLRGSYDNNLSYFEEGKVKFFYYCLDFIAFGKADGLQENNIDFVLTPAGTTAMIKAYLKAGIVDVGTGTFIMRGLDQNLKDFDNATPLSYLNIIESGDIPNAGWDKCPTHPHHVSKDGHAYFDFEDHLGQASRIVHDEANWYRQGMKLGKTVVRFHYSWHCPAKDDFDVSFESITPFARVLW